MIVPETTADRAVRDDEEIRGLTEAELCDRIHQLRDTREAVILAHNYQNPAIQDLADFVGDSLDLSRQAAATSRSLIVFCGVHFMAETAAVLCPDKRILIPDGEAGCSLAETVTVEELRAWKADHPGAVIVAYVNTSARVKAEVDYCCTSGNAVAVIQSVPPDREILFVPDRHLGYYLRHQSGRHIHLWPGECHVHADLRAEDISARWEEYPDAHLLLHPECGCISQCLAAMADGELHDDRTFILGTGGMTKHARSCNASADLIGTETGLLHRLRKENPAKQFVPLRDDAVCPFMKLINLQKLYRSLRDGIHEVTVPTDVADRARIAIERMLAIT